MKDKIHPDYHEITVIMTDGTSYKTRSTYGKPGDTLNLEIDSRSHPAWTGGQQKLLDGGQLARFNKRFQGQGLGLKPGEAPAAKPATAAKPAPAVKSAEKPAKAEKPAEKAAKAKPEKTEKSPKK